MRNIAVLGAQLGDEAKGKVVHYFAPQFDWIVRHGSSSNCGHVVYRNGKKYTHHLLPSVNYLYPQTKSFLGCGMYIHLPTLSYHSRRPPPEGGGCGRNYYTNFVKELI